MMSNLTPELVDQRETVEELTQALTQAQDQLRQVIAERDKISLLYQISAAFSANPDIDAIMATAVSLHTHLTAVVGEVYLLTDTGEAYFKASIPEQNNIDDRTRRELVYRVLTGDVEAQALSARSSILISDTALDSSWHPLAESRRQFRSFICAPVVVGRDRLKGAISFAHPSPNHFSQEDLMLSEMIASEVATTLENAFRLSEIQINLQETHLMLDISRRLAAANNLNEVYDALVQSVMATGADRCVLYMCEELNNQNLPTYGQVVLIGDANSARKGEPIQQRFPLEKYPVFKELVQSQETLVIENISTDPHLTPEEEQFLTRFGTCSIIINPLVTRSFVTGLLSIEYRAKHFFTERELALYRTLCNQTTIAIEHARQVQRTEEALAETQTLYRAGRVLAGAADLQEILEESLVEFVYSLGLDQGGVTLLTPDRQTGQLMAYLENGQLQSIEQLRFPIKENIPYQQALLAGQPFVSSDVTNDPRLAKFVTFNKKEPIKSMLQAPMIIRGETIGWIGADAVKLHRDFNQREVDLARAMADQIAITIQNRRLLEQTELRADRLKAVARVGKVVAALAELDEVLNLTVNLIRDRLGFYHVSIFLIEESGEWAVVRASTGEVGRIMVERPHRLGVGSNSIVGYVTANAAPRIALDVGEDAVHFENPLLPDTRSEMALPLISRGVVIGALDVQSGEPNAFTDEDIETLQIMADQLTTAIENARLFEQIERRLNEQALLYRIGSRVGSTLNLQEATDILVSETAQALDVAECVLSLLEEDETLYIISDTVKENSHFRSDQGQRFKLGEFSFWPHVSTTKQGFLLYSDDKEQSGWEYDYLKTHGGAALAIVPILLRNQVIGLLEVYDDKPGRRFRQEEISLLDSIALQAANAIENARLFESAYESQTFMKAIINQIPDPIFIKDREHRWTVVNTPFTHILGQPEENIVGRSDYDFLPKEQADWFWDYDNRMFETGETQEVEEVITNAAGELRTLYTRKIPLTLTAGEEKPEYLIGIINDITERKQREAERERLIEETRKTLDRTQTLYRISDALAAGAANQQATFEIVLGEYLQLLGLKQGRIMLFDPATNMNRAQARYIAGKAGPIDLAFPVEKDLVFQHLQRKPTSLIIEDAQTSPLTQVFREERGEKKEGQESFEVKTMLFIPLVIGEQLVGSIGLDMIEEEHTFSPSDIDIGEAIADQLTIWLENRRLLREAQYRSDRLQTAARVSQAASSILDINELINTSVNLIRDQFEFYYVGLFMVDEAQEWAVLRAGTGEAGRIQIERQHRLKIGGGSMIGWSIQNRRARIALDVGEEAVRFQNPYLPETHSEMALPLISRDEVLGALTVQSVERGAFSDEDITLLQTMADQLANAIENARLFENAERRLKETEALQQLSQALSGSLRVNEITEIFFEACTGVLGFDFVIFSLVEPTQGWIRAIAGRGVSASHLGRANHRLDGQDIMADIIRTGKTEIIEGWDERFDPENYEAEGQAGWGMRVFTPITLRQRNIGLVEAGFNRGREAVIEEFQMKLLRAFIDQTALALESAQRYEASQKAARREEIIREITERIRNAVSVEDILKTTLTELSKVVGASQGGIRLEVEEQGNAPISPLSRELAGRGEENGSGEEEER
jgi:PAS domain S-box-containing protein